MDGILGIAYFVLSYMAVNKVWYSRHTYIVTNEVGFFIKKVAIGVAFGWILIPIAIIMTIFSRK